MVASNDLFHTSLKGGGEVAAARQFTIGRFNRTANINLNVNLNAGADLVFVFPTYVFATPRCWSPVPEGSVRQPRRPAEDCR